LTVENFKFEETRRKIFSDLKDVSYYVKDKLKNKNKENDLKLILENFDNRMK
jgi:DsbC/DsbD-like thiol-disulfide interchange protein